MPSFTGLYNHLRSLGFIRDNSSKNNTSRSGFTLYNKITEDMVITIHVYKDGDHKIQATRIDCNLKASFTFTDITSLKERLAELERANAAMQK